MTKSVRAIREELKLVDLCIEVLDSRIPLSSRNPDIDELAKGKFRMAVLNKADLSDERKTALWTAYFKEKGIEVLLMTDDIDDLVISSVGKYKDIQLKAVNKSGAMDDFMSEDDKEKAKKEGGEISKKLKKALGDKVKDVVVSTRLSEVSAVVVTDENDPSVQMQQLLKAMGQSDYQGSAPILEVNPDDAFVKRIMDSKDDAFVADAASVLLDQALLSEGVMPKNPAEFARKLHSLLV